MSRLTEKKRIDFVMRAFEKVAKKVPKARLKVVGDGPEFENLEKLSNNLDADIEMLGYLSDKDDVIRVLKSSDLFVSASILEGFGMSVIEAAASGTPYVVSDIKPHVEVTKGERGGFVFERNGESDLVEKMLELLRDEDLYRDKKSECFGLAEEYDWGRIVEKLEKTYQGIVEA